MAKFSLVGWFDKYGKAAQGLAAIVTAFVAISALIGVKFQIDAAARGQQEQSARDIYREFLNLSINKPEFAEPDFCKIKGTLQEPAYKNYVDYLLYTSEQMLSVSPEWESTLTEHLEAHEQYLCSVTNWSGYPDGVGAMVIRAKVKLCTKAVRDCGQ